MIGIIIVGIDVLMILITIRSNLFIKNGIILVFGRTGINIQVNLPSQILRVMNSLLIFIIYPKTTPIPLTLQQP